MTAINPSLPATRNDIVSAIRLASANTGIDEAFMLRQAEIESGLDPRAKATTSSAAGLYQFIDQTWLQTVKRHGAKHGLGWAADSIEQTSGNRFSAGGRNAAEVLALRNDPRAAAAMAAEFAADNQRHLESSLGRSVGSAELYLAHFLGADGAARFLRSREDAPDRPAAELLPDAARANRPVFFTRSGQPRSLDEVYQIFAQKFEGAGIRRPDRQLQEPLPVEGDDALSATRAWVAVRNARDGIDAAQITPASARLVYLALTTARL